MQIHNAKCRSTCNGKKLTNCQNKKHMKTRTAKCEVTTTLLRSSSLAFLMNKNSNLDLEIPKKWKANYIKCQANLISYIETKSVLKKRCLKFYLKFRITIKTKCECIKGSIITSKYLMFYQKFKHRMNLYKTFPVTSFQISSIFASHTFS